MKVVTQRNQILNIVNKWESHQTLTIRRSEYGKAILEKFKKIDLSKATLDDVVKIGGNANRYIHPQICSECGKLCEVLVKFEQQPPDYESEMAYLCEECLEKALNLINNSKKVRYE